MQKPQNSPIQKLEPKKIITQATDSALQAGVQKDSQTLGIENTVGAVQKNSQTKTSKQVAGTATGKVSLGVVTKNFFNSSEFFSFQQLVGVKVSTVSIYKPFGGTERNLDVNSISYIKNNGSKLLLAWEPWDLGTTNYLPKINSGDQDTYIQSFAASIKQYAGQVTLRFGHEMNGGWYPWGNQPADYISAYRRIHKLFGDAGVSNVTWMWCPNQTWNGSNIDQFYPGADVVNTIGIDGFNFGTDQPSYGGWQSFYAIFNPSYQALTKYNKPLVIAETSSSENGGSKAKWISDMFSDLQNKLPKIKEVVWFNELKESDWRVDSSQSSLLAFQQYFQK